jgi:hypothetical protein
MMLAAAAPPVVDCASSVYHQLHGVIPLPWENHRLFGAGFLLVGVVLLVESLAGGVWHRSAWRREAWPAVLMFLGWGLVAVAVIDPHDRIIHLILGCVMIGAGLAERRYRAGEMRLAVASVFVMIAMVAGGLEMGVFHSHGAMTSQPFLTHALLGITAALVAPVRYYWSRSPQSMARYALLGAVVLVLSLQLLGLSHGEAIDFHETQTFGD